MKSTPAMRSGAVLFLFCFVAAVSAQPRVKIVGGKNLDGNYDWRITNHTDSPIVKLTFPHYQADLFSTPEGWEQDCTFLVNVGVPDEVGNCVAIAPTPALGIAKGENAKFEMRIMNNPRAVRGSNTVLVEFADGRKEAIPDVELPVPPPKYDGVIMIAAFGLLILLFILFRPKKKDAPPEEIAAAE
ncbi:MAG: hypothetical protein AB7N71_09675 [Phycisphaerae bacterium]